MLKSSPNSDEFGKVGLGEEFYLRCVLAPSKYVLGNFWIWAGGVLILGGFNKRGKGLSLYLSIFPIYQTYLTYLICLIYLIDQIYLISLIYLPYLSINLSI